MEGLIVKGYPIFKIAEENYSSLVDEKEWNLYQIVNASANQLGQVKGFLRKYVEKADPLDMDAYAEWIKKLYDEWPISGSILPSGRQKKKNAGEVSITILAEMLSWYYSESEMITKTGHALTCPDKIEVEVAGFAPAAFWSRTNITTKRYIVYYPKVSETVVDNGG